MKADHKEIEKLITKESEVETFILIGNKWITKYQFMKRISTNKLHEMVQKIHQKAIKQANEDIKVMEKISNMPNVTFLLRDGKFGKKRFLDAMYMIRVGVHIQENIREEIEKFPIYSKIPDVIEVTASSIWIERILDLSKKHKPWFEEASKSKDQDAYVVFFQTKYPLP